MTKRNLPPEVRAYFQEMGRKRGLKLKEERGSEYFKKIAAMRHRHGRQKLPGDTAITPEEDK